MTYCGTVISKDKKNDYISKNEKITRIKKLEEKIRMGKIKKLEEIKNEISEGVYNMNDLEDKIKKTVHNSTQEFRDKINKLQEKHYSQYINEWQG